MALSEGRLLTGRPDIERMPSSAGSDTSVFSNATEAESEMTEEGDFFNEEGSMTPRQTYFMCYATDLLSAYELIKRRSLSGVRAIDDVSFCLAFVIFPAHDR